MKKSSSGLEYLTLPLEYGPRETPLDFKSMAYMGGAACNIRYLEERISSGVLGKPIETRIPLIRKFYDEIVGWLKFGGCRSTAVSTFSYLRHFYKFTDENGISINLNNVVEAYLDWAAWMRSLALSRNGNSSIKVAKRKCCMRTAYGQGRVVGTLIDKVLGRRTNVFESTGLERQKHMKSPVGAKAEKQNLEEAKDYIGLLQDLCDRFTLQLVREEPFPLNIGLRNGKVFTRGKSGGVKDGIDCGKLGHRYWLANIRIEAEMAMFVAQTGINAEQVVGLQLRKFCYVSYLDGYQVKERKSRRGGAVIFEIYKDYRPYFERYLAWRRSLFPDSSLLFPFIGDEGTRIQARKDCFRMRKICKELNIPFQCLSVLRSTRINWLLRRSGDPEQTADMAQHSMHVLKTDYEVPSLQRTMGEQVIFWNNLESMLAKTESVAPGECTSTPLLMNNAPKGIGNPDCNTVYGCLFCASHRDLDDSDYVWALATFGFFKVLEVERGRSSGKETSLAKQALVRIEEKLAWFEKSGDERKAWVEQARSRVLNEYFHISFKVAILELMGGS
jgi:hypothetical protein